MHGTSAALFVLVLMIALAIPISVAWAGQKEYRKISAPGEARDLATMYKRWVLISFLAHFVSAVIGLALIGQLGAIAHFPKEFAAWPYSGILKAKSGDVGLLGLSDIALSLLSGALLGLAFVTAALIIRQRRSSGSDAPLLGQADSLMPRTHRQRRWWLLVSLNAGVSEELYYRLFLTLLLVSFLHNVLAAMLLSAAIFGLGHIYQGVRGMLATMLVGMMLSLVYFVAANLFVVVVLHVLIDVRAIFLAPRQQPARHA